MHEKGEGGSTLTTERPELKEGYPPGVFGEGWGTPLLDPGLIRSPTRLFLRALEAKVLFDFCPELTDRVSPFSSLQGNSMLC